MLIDINLKIQVIVRCASVQLTPVAQYTEHPATQTYLL